MAEQQTKAARGHAAALAMQSLQKDGFTPDVVVAHPGWGEALFAKDVFPRARLVVYAEYFYAVATATPASIRSSSPRRWRRMSGCGSRTPTCCTR